MRLAELSVDLVDRVVVAHIEGEIDLSNAHDLGAAIASRVPNEALAVVVDLSEVDYVDSAGIHVMFDLRNRLRARGQDLRLVVPSGSEIFEALRIVFLPQVVPVFGAVEEAIAGIADSPDLDL